MSDVASAIARSIEGMGQIELAGIRLESADSRLLDITHMDLDAHVAMQPAAIAYYGAMLKEATRRHDMAKRAFERWEKRRMADAKVVVTNTTTLPKSSISPADIRAQFLIDNERELEDWDTRLDRLRFEEDTLESWYRAWREKSFSIHEHAGITEDERWNSSSSLTTGRPARGGCESGNAPLSSRTERVRDIIRKRRGQQEAAV